MSETTTDGAVGVREYRRVFEVLERVDSARTVDEFAERTVEALGSVLGYRNTTFFRGATYSTLFTDPDPLLNGRMPGLVREYRSQWHSYDVFSYPESTALLGRTHAASVSELKVVPAEARAYLDDWLVRRGLPSVNALYLRPAGEHALLGIFGEDDLLGPADMPMLRLLARQLSALSRGMGPCRSSARGPAARLSPRRREVAELVCEGLTNARIGERLSLTEGTVKKYVGQVLADTGCRSRTELVLYLRATDWLGRGSA
ncbi:helix-turn-helix transcriptional regulator [Pseudonocardia alni]|uniref:helix-turn-helix transcriptional regulator n=1 Tax=Pseudonocardia alni TaxID=33907 RepID=UPI003324D492